MIGVDVTRLDRVTSTNKVATEFPIGTVVVAKVQDAGRGRLDHDWESPEGGLYLSCVLEPADPPTLYQFWAAVVVAEALAEDDLTAEVRWPNDILIDGRKISGILSENHGDRVVVGIGVNVNNPMKDAPFGAISMVELLGRDCDIDAVLDRIISRIESIPSQAEVMEMWRGHASTMERYVTVETITDVVEGKVMGVADDGALLVGTKEGTVRIVEGECRYLD